MKHTIALLIFGAFFSVKALAQTAVSAADAAKRIGETVTITDKVYGGKLIMLSSLMYFNVAAVFRHPAKAPASEITVQVVWNERDGMEQIATYFDTTSREPFREVVTQKINHFWGTFSRPADFTFYRKSDGKIYTNEICANVRELRVVVLANDVVKKFPDKREAFLMYGK